MRCDTIIADFARRAPFGTIAPWGGKGGHGLDTYIVRIYRTPKPEDSDLIVGIVEQVENDGVLRFSNFGELREILCKERDHDLQDR